MTIYLHTPSRLCAMARKFKIASSGSSRRRRVGVIREVAMPYSQAPHLQPQQYYEQHSLSCCPGRSRCPSRSPSLEEARWHTGTRRAEIVQSSGASREQMAERTPMPNSAAISLLAEDVHLSGSIDVLKPRSLVDETNARSFGETEGGRGISTPSKMDSAKTPGDP